jgi:RNA polymerase sigma factor (sigma-70 family)
MLSKSIHTFPVPHQPASSAPMQESEPTKPTPGSNQPESTPAPADDESRRQDDELVSRTQGGDTAAFDELIVKYSPRLYGMIYNMTSNHDDTHDMLQDIWAKAFRSISTFRGKSAFYTWIYSIAVNMTINFLKKRARRSHMSLDDLDSSIHHDKEFVELAATTTPVREANLNELQKRLNEAMQRLSHDHRTVVTMFDIQGMPHAEIAKILGISEGTVRSRLFYAHRQLQNFLGEFLQ